MPPYNGRYRVGWVRARREDNSPIAFEVSARIKTRQEVLYLRHGGILQYVLH